MKATIEQLANEATVNGINLSKVEMAAILKLARATNEAQIVGGVEEGKRGRKRQIFDVPNKLNLFFEFPENFQEVELNQPEAEVTPDPVKVEAKPVKEESVKAKVAKEIKQVKAPAKKPVKAATPKKKSSRRSEATA